MSGLVADYGSSDDDQDVDDTDVAFNHKLQEKVAEHTSVNFFETTDITEENSSLKQKKKKKKRDKQSKKNKEKALPKPFSDTNITSVFFNPLLKDQEVKNSILEKHVRMTDNPKDVVEINGKKICWNYRKGKCRFGHNCKYAHDSDINVPNTSKTEVPVINTIPVGETLHPSDYAQDAVLESTEPLKKKKRPGLSEGLVPGKKVLKLYKEQQIKESPWLVKR